MDKICLFTESSSGGSPIFPFLADNRQGKASWKWRTWLINASLFRGLFYVRNVDLREKLVATIFSSKSKFFSYIDFLLNNKNGRLALKYSLKATFLLRWLLA